jgi:acetolactate synthase-1/2/3 large subunit
VVLAGHAAAQALRRAGAPWVAGVAGESFLPLLDGLKCEGIPFLPFVHEAGATFAAVAYARLARRPAVVAVTRGPGASNALIGIHEAASSNAPVVLIVGQVESGIRGRKPLQEMEFTSVFASVAKATFEVTRPDQLVPSISAALRRAVLGRPGPVVVSVPADHFYGEVPEAGSAVPPESYAPAVLDDAAVARLAETIRTSRRGLFVVGAAFGGGAHTDALDRLASRTGFGVLGGHAYADVLPGSGAWLGVSSLRGSEEMKQTLREADLLVFLDHWPGDRVTHGYLPFAAQIVHISAAPEVAWDEYLGATILTGDAACAVEQLEAALGPAVDNAERRRAWVRSRQTEMSDARERMMAEARAVSGGSVPFPEIVDALDQTLPADVTIAPDAGSFNDWILRYLPFPTGRRYVGTISGSMGFGLPAAIGAQLARPGGRAVAFAGDGGFLMTGLELATAVTMKLPLTVVIFNNGIWGSIALHQDRAFPGRRTGIELPKVSFAGIATSLGALGLAVREPADLTPALRRAFTHDGVALVEIPTDPLLPSPSSYSRRQLAAVTSANGDTLGNQD